MQDSRIIVILIVHQITSSASRQKGLSTSHLYIQLDPFAMKLTTCNCALSCCSLYVYSVYKHICSMGSGGGEVVWWCVPGSARGMIHDKIHPLSSGCPRPCIALQFSLKHHFFLSLAWHKSKRSGAEYLPSPEPISPSTRLCAAV